MCQEFGIQLENSTLFDIDCCTSMMLDEFKHTWKALIIHKPKLRTLVTFKNCYLTEHYVSLNLSRNQRSVLAQLRCGILPLEIETGRYSGVSEENRLCKICNSGEIENEVHFVFNCSMYQHERLEFSSAVQGKYNNFTNLQANVKLYILFTLEPRLLAKFVVKILEKRQNSLYG
jgi:hypothetical protein